MGYIFPDWIGAPAHVCALTTLRGGGVSAAPFDDGGGGGGLNLGTHVGDRLPDVVRNRALLRAALPAEPAWLTQVHGTVVLDAHSALAQPVADASIALQPGVVCAILTADCLPVLFCDAGGTMVGAAHAGWRGLAGGVLQNTVATMRAAGSGELLAWLGPAIGPERFEVGQDVLNACAGGNPEARTAFKPIEGRSGKYLLNIYQLARIVLRQIEVRRVYGGGLCTVTDQRRFYSYRREHVTGRMASLIWIKPAG